MVSVSKLSRALVNTACYRGRKRVSRLAVLLLVMGILVVGLRQAYVELSQQNVEDVVKKKSLQSVGGDAPGRGELMTKVSFERVRCLLILTHALTIFKLYATQNSIKN